MSTTIAEQIIARPTLAPIECAPWCKAGNGHPDATQPEDQWCSSDETRLELGVDRHPSQRMGDGTWERDYMRVYVYRDAESPAALVDLGRGEWLGTGLSASEARLLGEALVRAAALAEGVSA